MTPHRANSLLVTVAVATVLAGSLLAGWYRNEREALDARQQAQLDDEARRWPREDAARKLANHEEKLAANKRRDRELAEAWGGQEQAPLKNPDLDLRKMLEQTAQICAPTGTLVTARAERFTEFEVSFEFTEMIRTQQLARICACLLRHGTPYVSNVRLLHDGRVLATLDQAAIVSVPDWSKASPSAVEYLFLKTDVALWLEQVTGDRSEPAPTTDMEADLTRDTGRLRKAGDAFNQTLTKLFERLGSLTQNQDAAVQLGGVRTLTDLKTRLKLLEDNERAEQELYRAFLATETEYRRVLEEQKFEPLVVTIMMRAKKEQDTQERPFIKALFDALRERQRGAAALLAEMQAQWGEWTGDRFGTGIDFSSQRARDAYEKSTKGFEAAMRDFMTRQGGGKE